jgi:L-threonylcarbamoyladenylate synthase
MESATQSLIRPADARAIADAAAILRKGGLVALPTETVYGLGADATNGVAVAAVFAAKGRPSFNPLIVHVGDVQEAEALVDFTPSARALAKAFWPGPLTLVLRRTKVCPLSLLVSAGLDTVALRVPAHPIARALIAAVERPIAAPSANVSGRVSPTTAAHVAEELGHSVSMILDGGATDIGIESTVIGFENDEPVLLRPGGLARSVIERIAGPLRPPSNPRVQSPGQLESHYAPRATLRLNARAARNGEVLLAFGADAPEHALNLSPTGDLKEAAANLFAMLRALDRMSGAIAVMPIPHEGLGEAINDRLERAAAPRGDVR